MGQYWWKRTFGQADVWGLSLYLWAWARVFFMTALLLEVVHLARPYIINDIFLHIMNYLLWISSNNGQLHIIVNWFDCFPASPEANYWVVETDYETYSLVWSCAELVGLAHADIGWILGREQTLDEKLKERLKRKLSSLGLQYKEFFMTSQPDNCPWWNL